MSHAFWEEESVFYNGMLSCKLTMLQWITCTERDIYMQQKLDSVYYLNKLKQRTLRQKLGREIGRSFGSSQGGEGKYERNASHTYMKLISQRTKHNENKTIMKRTTFNL